MTLTRRGWATLGLLAAFAFGIATGDWTYYDYQDAGQTTQEVSP